MRLKSKKSEREASETCAASRCHEPSTVLVDTNGERYGLCDRHWRERCDEPPEVVSNSLDNGTGE